jgi:hypothetical protein
MKLLPPKIETKLVTEVQERVITRTRIIERPDGTKETIIDKDEKKDTKQVATTYDTRDVTLFAASSVYGSHLDKPVYTIGVTKNVILGVQAGLYARTDSEYGVILSYSF